MRLRFLLPAACVVASCAGSGQVVVSYHEEWDLGERLSANVLAQTRALDDSSGGAYLSRLAEPILAEARGDFAAASLPWRFTILDDAGWNAVSLPGGHVFLASGLVLAAENDLELAALLAHQIAHGLERHVLENLTVEFEDDLEDVLESPDEYGWVLESMLKGKALAGFGRGAEDEADRLAVAYAYKADVDPLALVAFSRRLVETSSGQDDPYLLVHGLSAERVDDLQRRVRAMPFKAFRDPDPSFESFRDAVRKAVSP